jgi:predicted alpha/beta-fold hydrolase
MALAALPQDLRANGVVAVGFSLGGNMLLKFLGEYGAAAPLRAAVSISAPIDLELTSRRMAQRRNYVYQAYLLRDLRIEAVAPISEVTDEERRAVARVRSIWEYDEAFTAPRNGYANAAAYYEGNSAQRVLGAIGVPTLVIHAMDDPWVPSAPYRAYDWTSNPYLVPLLPERGGHVGFHARDHGTPWSDRAAAQFFEAVLTRA